MTEELTLPIEDLIYEVFGVPKEQRIYQPTVVGSVQLVDDGVPEKIPPAKPVAPEYPPITPALSLKPSTNVSQKTIPETKSLPRDRATPSPKLVRFDDKVDTSFESPVFHRESSSGIPKSDSSSYIKSQSIIRVTPSSPAAPPIPISDTSFGLTSPLSSAVSQMETSSKLSNAALSVLDLSSRSKDTVSISVVTPVASSSSYAKISGPKSRIRSQKSPKQVKVPHKTESEEEESYWLDDVPAEDFLDVTVSEWCDVADNWQTKSDPSTGINNDETEQQKTEPNIIYHDLCDLKFTPLVDTDVTPKLNDDQDKTIHQLLEEAPARTVDELFKVYLPTFEEDPDLTVESDAYYESEPDTLSCCSEPPDADAEDRMEQTAWEIQLPEIFELLRANVGHVTEYAVLNHNTIHALVLSKGLTRYKDDLIRLMRCLCELMNPSRTLPLSGVIQAARQIYLPFGKKIYVTTRLDPKAVYARTTTTEYDGFVARPVMGLWVFCFYDRHSHPAVTIDMVNSVVDYLNFCIFNCLPDCEDGFENRINTVLEGNDRPRGKRKTRHEKQAYTSQQIFALPVEQETL